MKIKNKLATILIFLLAVSQQQYAQAATFELGTDQSGYTFIKVSGSIEPGDGQTFAYKVKSWADQGKPVQIVVLNSIGGRVQEAYYIYKTVLNYRINTIVLPSNVCLSACVSIFAAGVERIAAPDSAIGVHRVSLYGEDSEAARSASINMLENYDNLGIPLIIQTRMIKTPPSDMYYLTIEEKMLFNRMAGDTQQAIDTANKIPLRAPSRTLTKSDKIRARDLNAQGIKLINQKNYLSAINVLYESNAINPADSEVLGNLGYAYYMAGHLDSAQNSLTASLKLKDKRGATWNNLGLVLAARGNVEWATQSFINYWQYSSNKKAATNQFFYWESVQPGTALEQASKNARAALGLHSPIE